MTLAGSATVAHPAVLGAPPHFHTVVKGSASQCTWEEPPPDGEEHAALPTPSWPQPSSLVLMDPSAQEEMAEAVARTGHVPGIRPQASVTLCVWPGPGSHPSLAGAHACGTGLKTSVTGCLRSGINPGSLSVTPREQPGPGRGGQKTRVQSSPDTDSHVSTLLPLHSFSESWKQSTVHSPRGIRFQEGTEVGSEAGETTCWEILQPFPVPGCISHLLPSSIKHRAGWPGHS